MWYDIVPIWNTRDQSGSTAALQRKRKAAVQAQHDQLNRISGEDRHVGALMVQNADKAARGLAGEASCKVPC